MSSVWKDKVIIITGASSGLGEEMAYQFAKAGAKLSLAARATDKLEAVSKKCQTFEAESIVVTTDVSSEEQCKQLIDETVKAFGQIDVLVNNAGFSMSAYLSDIQDLGMLSNMMQVNYMGSVYCTYYALPHLKKTKGQIVAVSSLAGKTGVPTRTGYCASKHAMNGFFDALRVEVAEDGIHVLIACPDFVATGIHERSKDASGNPLGKSHTIDYSKVMTTETCVRQIIVGMEKRKRELIMSPRGRVGQWIKLLFPGFIDNLARKAIKKGT